MPHLFVRCILLAVADIFRNRSRKEDCLLRHETDFRAQMLLRHLADIYAINQEVAAVDIVKTRDQAHQRRFARAGAAAYGHYFPWVRAEGKEAAPGLFRARYVAGYILYAHIPLLLAGRFFMFGLV